MTFCLAVGKSYIGMVAADTRTVTEDGLVEDVAELRFKNPTGGASITLPVEFRKIRRLRDGWSTGSGVLQWVFPVHDRLQQQQPADLRSAVNCVRAVSHEILPLIKRRYPHAVADINQRSSILLVQRDGEAFHCHGINSQGQVAIDVGVMCGAPREMSEQLAQQQLAEYEHAFGSEGYAHSFHEMLRMTARLFLTVYEACGDSGTVSNIIEIGMTRRTRSGRYVSQHVPPTPCNTVIEANDHELDSVLRTLP